MQPATLPTHFNVFHFSDSDAQAAGLRAWNQSYCQLSAGAFAGSVTEIDTGAVHIVVERLNRAVLQRGALPPQCLAVGVPLHLEGHSLLCGQRSHLRCRAGRAKEADAAASTLYHQHRRGRRSRGRQRQPL